MLNHNIIITSHLINTRFKLPKHCAQSSQFMIEPHKYYAQSSQPLPLSYTSLHCAKLSFQAYVNLFNESLNESIHTLLWIYSHIIVNLFTMLFMGLVNLFTHYCESIHNAIIGSVNLFTKCCESIHSAIHCENMFVPMVYCIMFWWWQIHYKKDYKYATYMWLMNILDNAWFYTIVIILIRIMHWVMCSIIYRIYPSSW